MVAQINDAVIFAHKDVIFNTNYISDIQQIFRYLDYWIKKNCVWRVSLFLKLTFFVTEELLLHIWYSLIAHMRNGLDSGSRSEMKDAFTLFLTQFQVMVLSQALPVKIILVGLNHWVSLFTRGLMIYMGIPFQYIHILIQRVST